MTTWLKENGQEIELNDEEATVKHAKSLGWNLKEDVPAAKELKDLSADELKVKCVEVGIDYENKAQAIEDLEILAE